NIEGAEGPGEQRLGGGIAGGDGSLQPAHAIGGAAPDQCKQHVQCQALTAHAAVNGDLPDKQGVGTRGWSVAGNEADQLTLAVLGSVTGGRKVGEVDEVAVDGMGVERRGAREKLVQGGFIGPTLPAGRVSLIRNEINGYLQIQFYGKHI